MSKWTYEVDLNRDIWRGGVFDTKEEAIKEGNSETILEGGRNFKVGITEEVYNFGIDVDRVIEDIQNTMYGEMGELAEDYLDDVTTEHRLELERELNEVFYRWQEKHNYKPTFYRIISEEIIEVEKDRGNIKQGLDQCACSKYGKSLNSGIKCSNCGREL